MVSARVWLWLVIVLVVTDSDSLDEAVRIPVRAAERRAEAALWAAEWVASVARWVVSRWPWSDEDEVPLDEELPEPPLMNPRKEPPTLDVELSVWKALRPLITSLNAELKVASVEVSAVADCWIASDSLKNS